MTGLVLAPFRGIRYAENRVSGLAEVTSPPYDVIASENEGQLLASDPHNVVRIIRPHRDGSPPGGSWAEAAAALAQWQADGILVRDTAPALYVYEQLTPGPAGQPGALQRGLIGAVALTPREAGIIRPHEAVAPGPVAGRLALMDATGANLEPIFLLYDGAEAPASRPETAALPHSASDGSATRIVTMTASGSAPPLAQARTADGIRHRLWAVTGPAELAAIAADLAPRTAVIADGHHRYAAYLELQQLRHDAGHGDGPWDYGLALLVDSAAYPPHVAAIHRVIPGLPPGRAAAQAASAFAVRELPGGTADLTALQAALDGAATAGVAFVLAGQGRAVLLTSPDPVQVAAAMAAEPSPLWQEFPVAVLRDLLMARIWRISDDEARVHAVHDVAEAVAAADAVPDTTAVLCAPMSAADVYEVAARGEIVPRKATSFGPKPRTGLVMRTFAQG